MTLTERANQNPYFIFLIDGIGASITAMSLLLILPNLPEAFSMPEKILYFLGTIAVIFAAYSISNFFAKLSKVKLLIRIIAIANLAYCVFSGFIVAQLFNRLSTLDVVYFSGEILIVVALALIELKLASNLHK